MARPGSLQLIRVSGGRIESIATLGGAQAQAGPGVPSPPHAPVAAGGTPQPRGRGRQPGGRAPARENARAERRVDKPREGDPARPPRGVQASGLVPPSLCRHCWRARRHTPLHASGGQAGAETRGPNRQLGWMHWRCVTSGIVPRSPVCPTWACKCGPGHKYSITHPSHKGADMVVS